MQEIAKECNQNTIDYAVIEVVEASQSGCFRSALLKISTADSDSTKQLALVWQAE
mgnify:FL=1